MGRSPCNITRMVFAEGFQFPRLFSRPLPKFVEGMSVCAPWSLELWNRKLPCLYKGPNIGSMAKIVSKRVHEKFYVLKFINSDGNKSAKSLDAPCYGHSRAPLPIKSGSHFPQTGRLGQHQTFSSVRCPLVRLRTQTVAFAPHGSSVRLGALAETV